MIFIIEYSFSQEISDINHIIHMGQSLGAGEQSMPIVTNINTGFGNLSFKMGTHTWNKRTFESTPELRDSTNFTFIPLTAHVHWHEGETIGNGLCDHLKNTSSKFVNKDFAFLFTFSGQGGRLIRELDKRHDDAKDPRAGDRQCGGGFYKTVIDDVKRAKLIANSKSLSYSVFGITWMQGESNGDGTVSRWESKVDRNTMLNTYINDLIQLKRDFQSDIKEITNQQNTIPFFTYQTCNATFGDFVSPIGTAQYMACQKEKDMYMVAATYMLPNAYNSRLWNTMEHGDGIHLTADGERWLGEMFGKVMRRVVFEKEKWKPLHATDAWITKDKRHIRVRFYVPNPPLVLDTMFLPKQGKTCGFELYDSLNVCTIKNVTLIDSDLVEIELPKKLERSEKYFIKYGHQSHISDISKSISKISSQDSIINGVAHIRIEFNGDIMKEFNVPANEGVFKFVNRNVDAKESSSILIRKVFLNENGNTILLGEKNDLVNVPFKKDQFCSIFRRYEYGNLRDSDPEISTFSFSDGSYGNRYGQKYPLFNWCIAFQDLLVRKSLR